MAGLRHANEDKTPGRKRTYEPLVGGLNKSLPILQKDVLRHLPTQAKLELGRAIEKSLEGKQDIEGARMRILESMLGREHLEQMADIKTEMEGMCRFFEETGAGAGHIRANVRPILRLLRLQGGMPAYLYHASLIDSINSLQGQRGRVLLLRFGLMGNSSHTYPEIGKKMDISASSATSVERNASFRVHRQFPEFSIFGGRVIKFVPPFESSDSLNLPLNLRANGLDTIFDVAVRPSKEMPFGYLGTRECSEALERTSFGIVDGQLAYYRQEMPPQELLAAILDLHISSHTSLSIDDVIKFEQAGITTFKDAVALSVADLKRLGFSEMERRRISYIGRYGIAQKGDKRGDDLSKWWGIVTSASVKRAKSIPIPNLGMSLKAHTSLKNAGIFTFGDFVAAGREEISALKGVGKKSMEKIEEALKEHGLSFDMF